MREIRKSSIEWCSSGSAVLGSGRGVRDGHDVHRSAYLHRRQSWTHAVVDAVVDESIGYHAVQQVRVDARGRATWCHEVPLLATVVVVDQCWSTSCPHHRSGRIAQCGRVSGERVSLLRLSAYPQSIVRSNTIRQTKEGAALWPVSLALHMRLSSSTALCAISQRRWVSR